MSQRQLWIGIVHFKPITRRDWSAFEGGDSMDDAGAYTHIVTWAASAEEFRSNAEIVAADSKLYVANIENEKPLSQVDPFELSEELIEIAKKAESNPKAIMWGTFFTYPHDDA